MPGKKRKLSRNAIYGYLFILPTVGGYMVFSLIPTLYVFVLSLFEWDLVGSPAFIGLGNYSKLFANDEFWNSLKVTVLYVLYNIPVQLVLSVILALLLYKPLPYVKPFRVLFLVPWVTTPVAIAIVWKWVLNPNGGLMNYFFDLLGIDAVNWFSSSNALKSIAMVNIWQHTGFSTLLLFIGLQSIPKMFFEAANIDGANKIQTFFRITLPLMKPVLMFFLITGFIGSFQVFDSVYALTKGGPGISTKVYYYTIYEEGFHFLHMGYASAMAVILFFILMFVTLVQFRLFRNTTYDLS